MASITDRFGRLGHMSSTNRSTDACIRIVKLRSFGFKYPGKGFH